ncbi:MAG: winged helix-turn-helix transcriptional regulator [Thermoplasmata archaeon]|nr:winged helix-turn-helix transcriptional regulator [Thermoplasmata archaeon]
MSKHLTPEDIEKTVLESRDDLARTLRAVAHDKRLQLLALVVGGRQEFAGLLKATGLSKTALANHLSQLIDSGLIERLERGSYQLTADGRGLLGFLVEAYKDSQARERAARKRLLESYSRGYGLGGGVKMESFEIDKKAEYEPGWISYVAAVAGVLKSLGVECDVVDVAGYSGYAFIVNVSKGMTCPSGPTAHRAWDDIHKGTEVFGWSVASISEDVSYPRGETVTSEDLERARKHFELVKNGLVQTKRPVVMWGIPVPEYGIVNGYSGDSYEVSTFRRLIDEPDAPIGYDALQAPGCLEALFFEREIPVPDIGQRDLEAVKRAVQMAEGAYAPKGYTAGPDAYEEWAGVLEKSPDKVNYHGNSYVGACTCEGKAFAAQFLRRVADRHKERSQGEPLEMAVKEYERAQRLMEEFVGLFPFAMEGDLPSEKLTKGAAILRKIKPHEAEALGFLRKAVEVWE